MASGDAFEILKHNQVYGDRRKARQSGENATTVGTIQRRKQMTARQRTFLEIGTFIFAILCAMGAVYAWGTGNAKSDGAESANLKAEIHRLDTTDTQITKRIDEMYASQIRMENNQQEMYKILLEIKRRGK